MFVNYFADDARESPINPAVARLVLGGWLIWKSIWYDWSEFVDTPYRAVVHPAYEWAIPVTAPWVLTVEKWLLVGLLCLFIVGYRLRVTALLCTIIAAHLGTVRYTLHHSGETEAIFIGAMMLLFFALYAEYNHLSVDRIRRAANEPTEKLRNRLQEPTTRQYSMPQLKFGLLALAVVYFGSGIDKITSSSGFGFAAADNMARIITLRPSVVPALESILLDYPILLAVGGWGTLVLETGFLLAVIVGVTITPFALGIFVFTLSNLAVLGLFFSDALFFLATFAAYDRIHSRLALDRQIDLVFDDHCRFCMWTLLPFKLLDSNGTVEFHGQRSAPETYRERETVDFDRALYVFHDSTSYEGYYAFRELVRQYRVFLPLVWLLSIPAVAWIGERVYRFVSDHRGQQFTCRSDTPPE